MGTLAEFQVLPLSEDVAIATSNPLITSSSVNSTMDATTTLSPDALTVSASIGGVIESHVSPPSGVRNSLWEASNTHPDPSDSKSKSTTSFPGRVGTCAPFGEAPAGRHPAQTTTNATTAKHAMR